jgi:predicted RNase H-like nuclease (RuvC/YqgF family)
MSAESAWSRICFSEIRELKAEIARLKQLNLMTDEQVVMDLKAEIEQLKQKIKEQEEYIAKLKRNAKGITGQ